MTTWHTKTYATFFSFSPKKKFNLDKSMKKKSFRVKSEFKCGLKSIFSKVIIYIKKKIIIVIYY